MKELILIQKSLKAPKSNRNSFGNYNYRSCEDILEAVKPLLAKNECYLTLTDEVISVGNRIYIRATATLTNSEGKSIVTSALAREEETKKGMDASQITGAASSYARKYALNGLFCIDDTKDADTDEHRKQQTAATVVDEGLSLALDDVKRCTSAEEVKKVNQNWAAYQHNQTFKSACRARFNELTYGTKNN